MERVLKIGIYDYINEQFPGSKENKVFYYRELMKRPHFFHAHIEWLYNNPNAFAGDLITSLKECGVKEYIQQRYCGVSPEKKQADEEIYTRILRLEDEQDEEYCKHKYNPAPTICRGHHDKPTVPQRIQESGIYAYVERYGGLTTGSKLHQYYTMITNEELFECHCEALQTPVTERHSIFPLYNISRVFI